VLMYWIMMLSDSDPVPQPDIGIVPRCPQPPAENILWSEFDFFYTKVYSVKEVFVVPRMQL